MPISSQESTIATVSSYSVCLEHHSAVRIIYGHSRVDHIMPTLRDRLHWLWLPQQIEFKRCLLVYKALHGLASIYVTDFCIEVSSRRNLRSSMSVFFTVPSPAKTFMLGEHLFALSGPSLWNHLPDAIKQAGTVEDFKETENMSFSIFLSFTK